MWISSLSVLQFQISRRVRRHHKNQSLKKETICKRRKTNYAGSCVLSSTSSTQQFNAEPYQGGKKSSISHPRAIPSHIWHLESARLETKDQGWRGGKLAAFATDRNRWHGAQSVRKDARHACWGYLWQHLMLLKDCCGGCLVVWLAPTRLRTGRQMHSYVRTYIRVSLFSPWGLSVFTLWAGRLCGLEKTTTVTQGTPTSGSRRRPVLFSVFVIRERIINADLELIFQDQKHSTHWPLEAIWTVKTQSRMISRKMAHLCLKAYHTNWRAERTPWG